MLEHRGDGCGGFIRDKYSVLPPGPRDKSRFHVTEPITTGFGMEECGFSRNSLYM